MKENEKGFLGLVKYFRKMAIETLQKAISTDEGSEQNRQKMQNSSIIKGTESFKFPILPLSFHFWKI